MEKPIFSNTVFDTYFYLSVFSRNVFFRYLKSNENHLSNVSIKTIGFIFIFLIMKIGKINSLNNPSQIGKMKMKRGLN